LAGINAAYMPDLIPDEPDIGGIRWTTTAVIDTRSMQHAIEGSRRLYARWITAGEAARSQA
jgi:hypothetical protein